MVSIKNSDKADVINHAQKLAAKGMIDKAISEWQKLLSRTQNDGNIYNTIGDLHLKANHTADAFSAYLKAADVFKAAGFELKSAAIYKKIIKIDSTRLDVYEKLADLHADRGLTGNAAEDYLRVAKQYGQRGDHGAMLSVYQKISRLDPKNCDIRIKIAETCKKLGLDPQAVEAYDAVRRLYEERNLPAQAKAILDQILRIDPAFLPRKETVETAGSSEVSPSTKSDLPPEDSASLASPDVSAVIGYSEGDADLSADANRSIPLTSPFSMETADVAEPSPDFEPEPSAGSSDDQMERLLAAGDWASGQALLEAFSDRPVDQFNYLALWVDALLARQAYSGACFALRSAIALSEEYASFSSEIQGLIVRYLDADPDHLSAYPVLTGHLEKSGRAAEVASIYSRLISILQARGNDSDAEAYYETLKARFPDTTECQQWQSVFEPPSPVNWLESTSPFITTAYPADDIREDIPPVIEETILDERLEETMPPQPSPPSQKVHALSDVTLKSYLTEAEVYIKYRLYAKAIDHLEMVVGLAPGCIEPHAQLKDLYVKQGDLEKAAVQHLILAQLYDEGGMPDQKEEILASLDALDPEGIYHQEKGPIARSDQSGFESDGVGGEGDAVPNAVEAWDRDDVESVVEEIVVPLSSDPCVASERPTVAPARSAADSSLFIDRISADFAAAILDQMQNARRGGSLGRSDSATDDDLADAVSGGYQETSPETSDARLNNAINKMKDAGPLMPKYLKTRYDLGVAYQEMGLLPDAIKEFEMVIEAGFCLGEAYAMIARCHQENDAFELAEHLLNEGLKDARCTPDERHRLACEIEALHHGAEESPDRMAAETDGFALEVGKDGPTSCDVEVVAEKSPASADAQPAIAKKPCSMRKRIAYL